MVLFLDLSSAEAAKRGGYGEERYETQQMQAKVRALFDELFAQIAELKLRRIDAGRSIGEVAESIHTVVTEMIQSEALSTPLQKLTGLSS
jgi:dTMP kinase